MAGQHPIFGGRTRSKHPHTTFRRDKSPPCPSPLHASVDYCRLAPPKNVASRQSARRPPLSFFASASAWEPLEAWSRTNSSLGRTRRSCPDTHPRKQGETKGKERREKGARTIHGRPGRGEVARGAARRVNRARCPGKEGWVRQDAIFRDADTQRHAAGFPHTNTQKVRTHSL